MFRSPGRSDPDEKDVCDDGYVDGCEGDVVRVGLASQSKRCDLVPLPAKLLDLMQFDGDPDSLCGMCVAQFGEVPLGARRAVWAPSCVLADVVVGVPNAVAEGGCAAAGGQESRWRVEIGVSDAESKPS